MKIKTKRGARRIRNQRVITRRFVTTDYTGCRYITAGKRYEVIGNDGGLLRLEDVTGIDIITTFTSCPHLNYNDVALTCRHLTQSFNDGRFWSSIWSIASIIGSIWSSWVLKSL